MNKKLNIHNFWRSNIFIIIVFVIMSMMSGILMYHSHLIGTEYDLTFHWRRIYEIKDSIINGNFLPIVTLNKFNQSGSALMSMYPAINLFPAVFLSFVIKSPIALFNILFILRNLCDLLISYYSSFSFTKNKQVGFIFSVSYVFTTMSMYYYFGVSALGTLSVISYFPLLLFGFLSLVKYNRWSELAVGMTLIIFSHILSTGIVILFLAFLFLINIKLFRDATKLKSLIKSVCVTILTTSVFWIPFIVLSYLNELNIPTSTNLVGNSFSKFIYNPLDNFIGDSVTLTGLIGLILALINYKKISKYSKQLLWIAVLFIIIASDVFPWSIASHTFIQHLQFPSRLYIVPQVILCYLFAECIVVMTRNLKKQSLILGILSVAILVIQMGAQENLVNNFRSRPELTNGNYNANSVIRSDKDFNNALNPNDIYDVYNDYYPASSVIKTENINNHIADFDNDKKLSVKLLGNGKFFFNNYRNIKKLSLPFLYYNGIDYQVRLDGKIVKGYPNKNALMTVNNVHKGKHYVQIIVHKTNVELASYILSLIGLLTLIGTNFKNFIVKRKIE